MHIVYLLLEITLFRGPSSLLQVWAQFACPRPVFCVLPMSLTWDTFRITSHAWLVLWNDSFFIACDIFPPFSFCFPNVRARHLNFILSRPFPSRALGHSGFHPTMKGGPDHTGQRPFVMEYTTNIVLFYLCNVYVTCLEQRIVVKLLEQNKLC